jgi:hypothetical protein
LWPLQMHWRNMSIYQCEECGCAENTALGWYWAKDWKNMVDPKYEGRALCSACGPTHFIDGTKVPRMQGKWHGQFERTFYPKGSMETDEFGNLVEKRSKE